MGVNCTRCSREIFPFDGACPFCGRENERPAMTEMSMAGLREACARVGIVPEVYGLTIGSETAFPGTGAIFAAEGGIWLVIRVREDGTREVLSEGTEEGRAAAVFTELLKTEWMKKHPGYRLPGTGTSTTAAPSFLGARHGVPTVGTQSGSTDMPKLRTRMLGAAFLILVLLAVFYYFKADKNAGYYTVNGVTYVYYDETWFTGEGTEWTPCEMPEGFSWDGEWEYDTLSEDGFKQSPYYKSVTWPSLWGGEP